MEELSVIPKKSWVDRVEGEDNDDNVESDQEDFNAAIVVSEALLQDNMNICPLAVKGKGVDDQNANVVDTENTLPLVPFEKKKLARGLSLETWQIG